MRHGLLSRLTYANVMATVAVFLALGGGAYALTGIPDSGGVFHGCVSNANGTLRVIKSTSACHKRVTRGRHRNPGEFAVSWNQQGPRGLQGIQGQTGGTGAPGQNATRLFAYIDDGPLTANAANDTAIVKYGSGVSAVSDPAGNSDYTVTFNRSLQNCVVNAVPSIGDPTGNAQSDLDAVPNIHMDAGGDHTKVTVHFSTGGTTNAVDTSFTITAFC